MPQVLELVAAAGDSLLLFCTAHIVVVGLHPVVAVSIGLQEAVTIAVTPGQRNVRQGGALGGLAPAGCQAHQATGFHRYNGIVHLAQAGEHVCVGLVGLVQVCHGTCCNRGRYVGLEVVRAGDIA
ncbi:hypothetical protein D3C80_1695720 [compost metagenome]